MTAISILGGDWEILLNDHKNQNGGFNAGAGMRSIQKAVATPTIVTTQTLYSAVAAAMDDFIAMGFRNSMLPTTPNAFTMPNKYFIPRSSTEFLREGAITYDGSITASPDTDGNGILKVAYTGGTNFVAADIGRQVIQNDSGDTGILLDFDIDPDGTLIAWIRPDDSTPTTGDIFDGTGVLQVTDDYGTGTSTSSTAGISGSTEYAAIQAIGAVPSATEVYLYQDRQKIASSDGTFQWWITDDTVSLGIISVLIQTQSAGVTIADGDVEVFARRYTSQYDNFRLNVSAGGFSALPLAASPDINNTTGYRRTVLDSSTGTWTVGSGMYVGATWLTATARAVITGGSDLGGATPTIEYYIVGDLTDIADYDVVTEYVFATAADGDAVGTADTPSANLLGPTDPAAGEGGTVTITLGHTDVDHTGDGITEPYSITVDCQGDVSIAKVYERIKYVCRRGAPNTDLFGAGTNVPGESYRGLDGLFNYYNFTSTMNDGEDIDTTTGGSSWTARLMSQNTTLRYATVTDQQTSVDVIVDADVVSDEGGVGVRDITIDSAGDQGGLVLFTSPKSSPFGTFTGSQIFGARGISFIGIATNPTSYILTDDLGTLNSPPTTVTFTVTNTLSLDRVLVARDTGTDGIIDKDQFSGLIAESGAFNGIGDVQVRISGTIDAEVPQSGYLRIVETTLQQEHHYVYDSRTISTDDFFLRTNSSFTGNGTDGTSAIVLNGIYQTFIADNVEVGMLIRDVTNGDFYEVVSVDSEISLTIIQIFGTGGTFADGDRYEINKLIQNYAVTDDIYDLILDTEATGTSVNNTFTKTPAADFDVVVNVRQGKIILPFTLNQQQQDGSVTVTVVRQPDTIAI